MQDSIQSLILKSLLFIVSIGISTSVYCQKRERIEVYTYEEGDFTKWNDGVWKQLHHDENHDPIYESSTYEEESSDGDFYILRHTEKDLKMKIPKSRGNAFISKNGADWKVFYRVYEIYVKGKELVFDSDLKIRPAKGSFKDNRDGEIYQTVTLGNQTWMAQNLRFKPSSKHKTYMNTEHPSKEYGRLYTWDAAMEACPDGWHLPDNDDWVELMNALGDEAYFQEYKTEDEYGWLFLGEALKSDSDWKAKEDNKLGGLKNPYAFDALPTGYYMKEWNTFPKHKISALFWSASVKADENHIASILSIYSDERANKSFLVKENGVTVRCIKD